ncbi:MAG: sodium:alanine symporter family protein [Prevotellaceae bacterium]|jgi:AGCS family alanine or glycine:cation symporter|nr:sodium:alanine symporter family protein [Prevotellaceae bacterium]
MDIFNNLLLQADSILGSSQWFVFLLLGTGLFFTCYLGFPQIRYFRHGTRVLFGHYDRKHHIGDTSHFQSLTTALSGTVGTGNIAGVALAIHLGGPSALFWMMVSAFLGMTTKFVEVSLSHKYRDVLPDGSIAGGPMYYMKKRMKAPWLAGFFAVAAIISSFGTGSLPQINSIAGAMFHTFSIPPIITGAVLSLILALIVIGGIKRIAKVTSVLVPFMSVLYIVAAIMVLAYNYQNILPSFISIFTNVFTGTAATGGFLGATFAFAFNRGVNRGLFSNEAGQGSAPIAHAAARTQEPVSEGVVALLEPFLDTLIICFLTGMTLLSSGVWQEKQSNLFQLTDMEILAAVYDDTNQADVEKLHHHIVGDAPLPLYSGTLRVENGKVSGVSVLQSRSIAEDVTISRNGVPYTGDIQVVNGKPRDGSLQISGRSLIHSAPLSTVAFSQSFLGVWGKYIISISLLFFAFSTAIAWSYYGDRSVIFLGGQRFVLPFRIIYCVAFFIASFTDTTIIWNLANVAIVLMTLPNLIGMLTLRKEMKSMERAYRRTLRKDKE